MFKNSVLCLVAIRFTRNQPKDFSRENSIKKKRLLHCHILVAKCIFIYLITEMVLIIIFVFFCYINSLPFMCIRMLDDNTYLSLPYITIKVRYSLCAGENVRTHPNMNHVSVVNFLDCLINGLFSVPAGFAVSVKQNQIKIGRKTIYPIQVYYIHSEKIIYFFFLEISK